MNEVKLPRIRNAKEAAAELKKLDPGTRINEYHVRLLMKSGRIPLIQAGQRQFTNLDMLITYLSEHPSIDFSSMVDAGGIRKIPERRTV